MTETTLEEAKRCPKCDEPGEHTNTKLGNKNQTRGAKNYEFTCRNERCKWLDTPYYVQVNPDGSIPPAYIAKNQAKTYPRIDPSRGKTIIDGLNRQLEIETSKEGTGEVRNPRG
jgi:hypothetical protein